jgi:hypothetical protein
MSFHFMSLGHVIGTSKVYCRVVTLDVFQENHIRKMSSRRVRDGRPPCYRPAVRRVVQANGFGRWPFHLVVGHSDRRLGWRTTGKRHGGQRMSVGSLGCSTRLHPYSTDVQRPDNLGLLKLLLFL